MTAAAAERDASLEARATGRQSVRLKPVEYVQLYGPPAARCSGCHHKKPDEHLAGGHLDRLVLEDLAKCAAWGRDGRAWGDESRPSVPEIARRIGYSDRSVQYALRRLERSGFVDRVERPGFTAWHRIRRPVEPVDEWADVVQFPVRNRRVSRRRNTGPPAILHQRGATVAPELGTEQEQTTPVVPSAAISGTSSEVGAAAPSGAAPRWRGEPPRSTSYGGLPPPAGFGSKPHRGDAGPDPALGVAPTTLDATVEAVLRGVAARHGEVEGDSTSYRLSRRNARRRRCPACHAAPGEACRRKDGGLRKSVHELRRVPFRDFVRGAGFHHVRRDDDPPF